MLSPRALSLLIRHLDSIDRALAKRLIRKTPWAEEALTALFCDLLDESAQRDEKLKYPLKKLRADLKKAGEPVSLAWEIETEQFNKHQESTLTQADIGLILEYTDQFEPANSRIHRWLLQAKRLFPAPASGLPPYDQNCRFNSHDEDQHERMLKLDKALGPGALLYLLYCPRPAALQTPVRERLSYRRTRALDGYIFDYAYGQQLRDDLLAGSPTIAAGVFISDLHPFPESLEQVHQFIFKTTRPFSWFLASQLADPHGRAQGSPACPVSPAQQEQLRRIIENKDASVLEELGLPPPPKRSIRLKVTCGPDRQR